MADHEIVLLTFLVLFAVQFLLGRTLALINANYIARQRGTVPDALAGSVSPEEHTRSVDYALARTRFGHVSALYGAGLTLVFVLPWTCFLLSLSLVWYWGLSPISTGVAEICLFTLISMALGLPLEIYETFWLEARFGFNKTTARTFWIDKIKGLLVSAVIGIPFLYAILALIMFGGPLWWMWATLFVIAFQFLMMLLFPLIIAPLFNKFTPLPDGELKTSLEELARKCDFAARGIFVVDGSRRSGHSNAYFTGIGKSRRIVLYDTLIQQLSVPQLTAVLAHEIGHYKKKHILKSLILSSLLTLAGFYVLSLVLDWVPLYQAFAITNREDKALGLLVCMLIAGAFTFWVGPLFHKLSRHYEYQADRYAFEQVAPASVPVVAPASVPVVAPASVPVVAPASVPAGRDAMSSALLNLYKENLSTADPHPAYSAWHYSHPTLLERLRFLKRLARGG
ncbi:MAG TPA: M48 family metallopeptidase [Planctomycetota bacterium]|jgi:STE24 endopeptidase